MGPGWGTLYRTVRCPDCGAERSECKPLAPAQAVRYALEALARLSHWISWTADPDLAPGVPDSVRSMREAAAGLCRAANHLEAAADRAEAAEHGGGAPPSLLP